MQRWAPYSSDQSSRQRGARGSETRPLAIPSNQSTESPSSQLAVIDSNHANSSSHYYHAVNATDNARLHLGDVHYHISQHEPSLASIGEQLQASLHFRQMSVRYDNIDDPHSETFTWIFDPPTEEQLQWSSFTDWLNGDGGIYWVSGKPGSGKSVLMKYLTTNFRQSLRSDNTSIVTLSFYFWEAAHTDLERNMSGCLRALLWQALQFSEHHASIVRAIKHNLPFEWTKRRLRDALGAVLRILLQVDVQVLIFLDGLDECGSDATEMMNFAIGVATSLPGLKICVSSRPEPIFLSHLEQSPHLKMQDLNRPDVLVVVRQELFDTPQFATLVYEGEKLEVLKYQLVEEAQGVLLWIRLVTRDLLLGIAGGDTFLELQARLQRLPSELEGEKGLYAYMLKRNASTSKSYLADAALYCQIACLDRGVSVLDYCLMTNDGLRDNYLELQDGWESLHRRFDCDRLCKAINARTGGLLEVTKPSERSYTDGFPERAARTRDTALTRLLSWYGKCAVNFIHRTARSYILETTSGQELLELSHKSHQDVINLAFEAWLILGIMLPCLESVAPVGADRILSGVWRHADQELTGTQFGKLENVLEHVAAKGYLWLESCLTHQMSTPYQAVYPFWNRPFAMTCEGNLSFALTLGAYDGYLITSYETQEDPAQLIYNIHTRLMVDVYTLRKSDNINRLDPLLSLQPNPNYELTNSLGESTSAFHRLLLVYSQLIQICHRKKIPTLEAWLQQASIETKTRICIPNMVDCSSLFFTHPSSYSEFYIIGAFDQKETSIFADGELSNYCAVGIPADAYHVRVLWVWTPNVWKPQMYILSTASLEYIVEQTPAFGILYSLGISKFYVSPEGYEESLLRVLSIAIHPQNKELKSLIDVFRCLGKSEAQIERFITHEEPRIKTAYCEIIYHHWREWLYGIEEPYLEQYRHIKKPGVLHFSVDK